MSTYTLTAIREGVAEVIALSADTRTEAYASAVGTVLRKFHDSEQGQVLQRLWRYGEITFRDPDGEVIQVLESGVEA
jgi:hypothetical protein